VLGNSDHNRTQQQRLQSVLDTLPDSVLMLDAEGRITDLNQAALSLLGATHPVEATGRPISDFVALDAVFAPIRQVIVEYDSTVMHRTFAARSDRHWHDYQVTMSGWKDSRWGLGGHIVVLHDSTDLRDLDRFKDEVLRIAASDLRSPLGVIAGYMELIALDTPDVTSPVHQYLGVIRRSTEQMKAMLDELLRVERVINSPLALQEATDFAKLVKVVLVNLRPLADDKNQSFEADLDLETVPRAAVDPVLLRLAMENLIDNAIRFTPEGGQVVVRAYVSDDRFHFETEDTGIGIAPEHLPRVFELFYRIPTETEGEEPGMGLGLSLVRNVVERHQGKVWARSQPGTGSQFGFSLPLS
jgi:two-component system phosphate regulon sensor histidine kinase PhoR